MFVSSYSQKLTKTVSTKEIPEKVVYNFNLKFKNTNSVSWELDKVTDIYTGTFMYNHTLVSIKFKESGEWVRTENEIIGELSKSVKEVVKSQCNKCKIKGAKWVEEPNTGFHYEIEAKSKEGNFIIHISPEGNFIKTETVQVGG